MTRSTSPGQACVVLTPGAFARRAFAEEAFAVAPDIWARNSPADDIWIRDELPAGQAPRRITTSAALRVTAQGQVRTVGAGRGVWTIDDGSAPVDLERITEDAVLRLTEAGEPRIVRAAPPRTQWVIDPTTSLRACHV